MTMTSKKQIRAAVEKVLRQVQVASWRPCPEITAAMKPIGDLDAFDSLMAVEVTVLLERELNCTLPDESVFISVTATKRALTVGEVVDRIFDMIGAARSA